MRRYISAREISLFLGPSWRTYRVKRVLEKMGIAKRQPGARGVFCTPEDLAGCWPDIFVDVLDVITKIPSVSEKKRHNAPWLANRGHKKQTNGESETNVESVSKQTRVKTDTNVCVTVCERCSEEPCICD